MADVQSAIDDPLRRGKLKVPIQLTSLQGSFSNGPILRSRFPPISRFGFVLFCFFAFFDSLLTYNVHDTFLSRPQFVELPPFLPYLHFYLATISAFFPPRCHLILPPKRGTAGHLCLAFHVATPYIILVFLCISCIICIRVPPRGPDPGKQPWLLVLPTQQHVQSGRQIKAACQACTSRHLSSARTRSVQIDPTSMSLLRRMAPPWMPHTSSRHNPAKQLPTRSKTVESR